MLNVMFVAYSTKISHFLLIRQNYGFNISDWLKLEQQSSPFLRVTLYRLCMCCPLQASYVSS